MATRTWSHALIVLSLVGCGTQGGSSARTSFAASGSSSERPAGDVRVYASGVPPEGAVSLGTVEVHGSEDEGTVEELLPLFVARVAALGGDAAVIDGIRARFEVTPRMQTETAYVPCGRGHPCATKTGYGSFDELLTVSLIGRAMTTKQGAASAKTPAPPTARPAAASLPAPPPTPSAVPQAETPTEPDEEQEIR